jgi:hypothetical protein
VRAVAAAVVLTGCFYIDPIMERPNAEIRLPSEMAARGERINAVGVFVDPEREGGTFDWSLRICAVATQGPDTGKLVCEDDPQSSVTNEFKIDVRTVTHDGRLVSEMRIKLDARDDRGSLAPANRGVKVIDAKPNLELRVAAHSLTAGVPIVVFAKYGDAELPYEQLDVPGAVSWDITPNVPMTDVAVPPPQIADPTHQTVARRLVAMEPGHYALTAVARDATCNASNAGDPRTCNMSEVVTRSLDLAPDQPPCLAQWQPNTPPSDQTLPIAAPTVFEVPLVNDDLDAFPRVSDEAEFGTPTFAWSIKPPGGARQVLQGATANRIVFDPGAYAPGDVVELRVEIFDRHHKAALTCDDAAATCAITADPTCLQRQTWRVEAR